MVDATDLGRHADLTLSDDKRKRRKAELDKLVRYDEDWACCGMKISDRGDYVLYDQVEKLLGRL